nr:metallophosphoesterase [Micromonospora sp. DSM 115978]
MRLLCEPYLLDPRPGGIHVVWHTDSPGGRHVVLVGPAVAAMADPEARAAASGAADSGPGWQRVPAASAALTRTREDVRPTPAAPAPVVRRRPVYRQLALVTGLPDGRVPYRVGSAPDGGPVGLSGTYTLRGGGGRRPVKLLLTSDHQLKPMVPANLAKVAETAGVEFDGVLMAGDLADVPDRASDWFDSATGPAFFATFQGRAGRDGLAGSVLAGRTWHGAPILQHSPLFPAIGNHEVMGSWSETEPLAEQFHGARPDDWDLTTYAELFPRPASDAGGPRWWSRTIGDVHVITLFATQIWRPPSGDGPTKYGEGAADLGDPGRWRHGQFVFEPVGRGSPQFTWLERELAAPAARTARFRVVMFHHPAHGLGDHSIPPYTDPVPVVGRDPATGTVTSVSYRYPPDEDQILRDLAPLFDAAGVHLVLNGHSHVWNRFRGPTGVNWLETSNVGNSYGAYHATSGLLRDAPDDYVRQGDPGGFEPIVPTIAPLTGPDGVPLPFVASDHVTVFSILDSGDGVVRSYRFDTRRPDSPAVLFDEFPLD